MRTLLLLSLACADKAPPPRPPVPVQTKTLALEPIRDASDFVGSLNSRQAVTLQAQVQGYVARIHVKPGDKVQPGATLILLDGSREEAALRNVQAQRVSRQAAADYAKAQAERNQELVGTGVVSQQAVEQARTAANAADAELNAVDAQIRAAQAQLQYYRISAPAAGTIGDIPVKVGDLVTPGTKLTSVVQGDALELYVQVPVEKAARITPDTRVEVLDDDDKVLVTSKLSFVSPNVEAETQLVTVKALFENKVDLRFAQFVRARVVWATRQGLRLPLSGIQRVGGQAFAYVVDSGEAKQRPVTLGALADNAYEVKKGLDAGQVVVTRGVEKLNDGARVTAE